MSTYHKGRKEQAMAHSSGRLDRNAGPIRCRIPWFCALSGLLLLGLLPGAAAAAEEETHQFDATLSLTGGCSVSATIDPVPDPGCPEGEHPPKPFTKAGGVAVDPSGDRYVASPGSTENGKQGRVDVFGPDGAFITEIEVVLPYFQVSLAVDSQGYLYVGRQTFENGGAENLLRYAPTKYDPAAGEITYTGASVVVPDPRASPFEPGAWGFGTLPLAINPSNDHLLAAGVNGSGRAILELSSAAEGNAYIQSFELEGITDAQRWVDAFAVDVNGSRLYVTDRKESPTIETSPPPVIRAYNLDAPSTPGGPQELLYTLEGDNIPTGRFVSETNYLPLAVDEATGHLFVGDMQAPTRRVYEFDSTGDLVSTIGEGRLKAAGATLLQLAYDDSPASPTAGYLFVPSDSSPGRSLAFRPKPTTAPPIVEGLAVSAVSSTDAILRGKVNPGGVETAYRIEYATEASFLAAGFKNAVLAGEGSLNATNEGVALDASASGLTPGTAYRFRIIAESPEGKDEADFGFSTFASEETSASCPNQALRSGPSATLPDCRAYELVTPPDTNGLAPLGTPQGETFTNRQVSPGGDRLPFILRGAPLSGLEGTGSYNGDPYLATRTAAGWSTTYQGPPAQFAPAILPLTAAPDQGYSFWHTDGPLGPAVIVSPFTSYLRYPDGHSELLGQGSLGTDYRARGMLISEGGAHIIFATGGIVKPVSEPAVQLEPTAAPDGTRAIYDRTADGALHVVSLKPGEVPFSATETADTHNGENAEFLGASLDGLGVAFEANGLIYLRHDDAKTDEAVPQALSGHQLTCAPGDLAGATAAYQWLRDGTPIQGATDPSYTPVPGDAGGEVQCIASAASPEGGAISAGDPRLVDRAHTGGPLPRGTATVSGKAQAGHLLTCHTDAWSANPSFSFQWYRDGAEVAGASADSYELTDADRQTSIQCGVRATASGASVLAFSSGLEINPPPAGPAPTVLDVTQPGAAPQVGDQLECEADAWKNEPSFSYAWLRNGSDISADADTHTVTAEDEGKALQCEVSGANPAGTKVMVSQSEPIAPLLRTQLPSGSLEVEGVYAVGELLECEPGSWQGEPTFSYRWLRNGTPIGAATTSSYTLTAEDRQTVVQCELRAENAAGAVLDLAGSFVNRKPRLDASVAPVPARYAGLAEGGARLFYSEGGDLWRFDANSETTTRFSEVGDAVPVTVSADGSSAYFISEAPVPGSGPNPESAMPQPGQQNLYLSREGQVHFLATVTAGDVDGEGENAIEGLGFWLVANEDQALSEVPARTTPNGDVLVFRSRARLTDYDSAGRAEIYRYDLSAGELQCLPCNPAGAAASADATLQFVDRGEQSAIFKARAWLENLRADGRRAFFETSEGLVAGDNDGLSDVYEWEEEGIGSCAKPTGCLYLISYGQSAGPEHLWAVSSTGDDVFFYSSDLLGGDVDETPSIYDARVDGGFPAPSPPAAECLGEACQPAAVAPEDPTPTSSAFQGAGNVGSKSRGLCAQRASILFAAAASATALPTTERDTSTAPASTDTASDPGLPADEDTSDADRDLPGGRLVPSGGGKRRGCRRTRKIRHLLGRRGALHHASRSPSRFHHLLPAHRKGRVALRAHPQRGRHPTARTLRQPAGLPAVHQPPVRHRPI